MATTHIICELIIRYSVGGVVQIMQRSRVLSSHVRVFFPFFSHFPPKEGRGEGNNKGYERREKKSEYRMNPQTRSV